MSLYTIIIGSMLGCTLLWWWVAERFARGRWWVWIGRIFLGGEIVLLLANLNDGLLYSRVTRALPRFFYASELIWYFLGLVLTLATAGVVALIFGLRHLRPAKARPASPAPEGGTSRRQFLGLAAVALPPLFTISLSTIALAQLDRFRVRRFTLAIPDLPRDLEGMTIAQVSDLHVGPFTSGPLLRAVAETVNGLRADLVLLTGDLINRELSDLGGALDLARSMPGRFGQCLIEGNHDLFENAREFDARARASGISFLRDEAIVLNVRGHPVQLLGVRWSEGTVRDPRESAIARSVHSVLPLRQADAFPILLAHHPHAFDAAVAAGLPLTLSGHTHGGQLMLNDHEGAGPILFRYWSGLYAKGRSQLVVSNGVGNWFPLRVNAPAEIVHLTLRRGEGA
jgi:predicted MPP superfamily phosphohydrolase